jgi:hypothetical protein
MKLAEFLAEFLANGVNRLHEVGMPMDFSKEGLQDPIQMGIEAFVKAEGKTVSVIPADNVQVDSEWYE